MQIISGVQSKRQSAIMGRIRLRFLVFVLGILLCIDKGHCIQCYQCDSNENSDLCPQEMPFDREINAMINCNSFEANTPGQFCVKIYQESPGWGGWIKITRRCASRTDQGVAWGCRWRWDEVGVFKNTCYCEADGCNGSSTISLNLLLAAVLGVVSLMVKKML